MPIKFASREKAQRDSRAVVRLPLRAPWDWVGSSSGPCWTGVCEVCNWRRALSAKMMCFHSASLALLWDGNKPRPSKHSQAPLTAECLSCGWTRLLSKQSADRLINRRVCGGACRSIFSHPANTRSFHSRGLLWGDPVTV